MRLDIRIPLGLLFFTIGGILMAFGLSSDQALYERSLHVNINLWWGAILLTFGLAMFGLGYRRRNR